MGVGVGEVVNYTNTTSGTAIGVVDSTSVGGRYTYVAFSSAFSPASLFAAGEQGAWYDPSDLTTLFQDSTGTTPVTLSPMEQPVGLMLDKSKGLALGAECYSTTGWTLGTNWSFSGNNLVYSGVGSNTATSSAVLLTDSFYKLQITTSGNVRMYIGTISSMFLYAGTYTFYMSNIGVGTSIQFVAQSAATTLSNISVKQIAGNHAFQATTTNRPLLSARVNLLTYTEDFRAWSKSFATVDPDQAIAPNGTLTADLITFTAPNALVSRSGSFVSNVNYTFTVYLWAVSGTTNVTLRLYDGITEFGLANIPISTTPTKYTLIATAGATHANTNGVQIRTTDSADTAPFYAWGADLRPTNSGALLPPYQRVTTATDYDTAGFPLYLKCNGLQSAMSTNTIDFTATDKMTVVTGIRKLAEAIGMILETSTALGSAGNAGAFLIHTQSGGVYRIACNGSNSGTTFVSDDVSTFVAPLSNVISANMDVSKSILSQTISSKVNGAVPTQTYSGVAIAGDFGNYPLYLFARAGTSLQLSGQFYGAIIRGATTDTAALTSTENYMATKTGITF